MEVSGLRRQPHDLVALELAMVLVCVDSLLLQGLDQTRSGSSPPRAHQKRDQTMPVYDYLCSECGPFTEMRPMMECDAAQACPECGGLAPRAFLTAPHFATMSR